MWDNLQWKTIFALMKDNFWWKMKAEFWWKTTFDGRHLCWKITFYVRQSSMEDNLQWNTKCSYTEVGRAQSQFVLLFYPPFLHRKLAMFLKEGRGHRFHKSNMLGIGTSVRHSSRLALGRWTGNDVNGVYKRHYFFHFGTSVQHSGGRLLAMT